MLQILTAVLAFAAPAALPPAMVREAPRSSVQIETCLPEPLLRGAAVVLLGMKGGRGAPAPFSFAPGGHAVRTVSVTGSGKGKLILVLAAYEPTVWDLSAVRDRVQAVLASGYYPQAVAGLNKKTPVRFSGEVGPLADRAACGIVRNAYAGTNSIEQMAGDAESALGVHPQRFYGGYAPTGFDVDGGTPREGPHAASLAQIRMSVPIAADLKGETAATAMQAYPRPQRSVDLEEAGTLESARLIVARRVVEWDETGTIIRDEGGGTVAPRRSERMDHWTPPSRRRSYFGIGPIGWWVLLGLLLLWLWRRRRRPGEDGIAEEARPSREPYKASVSGRADMPAHPAFPEVQIAELSALAAMTGSEGLVVALHRYGRELRGLSRVTFDVDLGDEINAIVERHFPLAALRYRQVRASLDGVGADQADDTLRRAVERLASRLQELRDEQQHRDMNGIDEAARFIDYRHPKE